MLGKSEIIYKHVALLETDFAGNDLANQCSSFPAFDVCFRSLLRIVVLRFRRRNSIIVTVVQPWTYCYRWDFTFYQIARNTRMDTCTGVKLEFYYKLLFIKFQFNSKRLARNIFM